MFEGHYSGAMQPMVHYIPLRKDFSNFDEVIERMRDAELRRTLVENAHRDLIASGDWSYARFIAQVDGVLADAGLAPAPGPPSPPRWKGGLVVAAHSRTHGGGSPSS